MTLIRWGPARRASHALIAVCVGDTASLSIAHGEGRGDAPHDARAALDAHDDGSVAVGGGTEDRAAVAAAARAAGWSLSREPVPKQDADRLLAYGSRDGLEDKYRYAGATPAGAVLGIAGAAVCVAGVHLWRRTPAASGPTAAIASGRGVAVGWAAAFY